MPYFYTKDSLEKMADKRPKTRKDLLRYLWSYSELQNIDIFKCGPEYTARIGKQLFAVHIRKIDILTFEQWRKRFETEYFPF